MLSISNAQAELDNLKSALVDTYYHFTTMKSGMSHAWGLKKNKMMLLPRDGEDTGLSVLNSVDYIENMKAYLNV